MRDPGSVAGREFGTPDRTDTEEEIILIGGTGDIPNRVLSRIPGPLRGNKQIGVQNLPSMT